MAHVKINAKGSGVTEVIVDGVNMTRDIMVAGFGVTFPESEFDVARVHMVVAADTLEMDLPESVIEALRVQEGESE